MDSCSSAPPPAAEGSRSQHAIHSSAKAFPLIHAAAAAAASSKARKRSASAPKPSARLHLSGSKILAAPGRHSDKKADALILQGPKSGEKSAARDEALRKETGVVKDEGSKRHKKALVTDEALQEEKAGLEDEALKKEKALAEDEAVGTETAATKDGTLGEEMTVYIDEALKVAGDQRDVSLLQEIKQNDIAEKEETKGDECAESKDALAEKEEKKGDSAGTSVTENSEESLVASGSQEDGAPFDQKEKDTEPLVLEKEDTNTENALPNFLKVPAQQDPSSPPAETKTIVYSEQNPKFSPNTGQTVPGCLKQTEGELDVKLSGHGLIFTEHLDSEQEGFLFAKGEPIFKESIQSSESLPASECSTLKKFKEEDVSSLSQFEAAVIAASDMKVVHSPSATVLDVTCNGISSMPSADATGLMGAAMVALAKDVLAAKCPPLEHKSVAQTAPSCPWKLPRRAFIILSLLVPALLCLCFASAVTQHESPYLRPT